MRSSQMIMMPAWTPKWAVVENVLCLPTHILTRNRGDFVKCIGRPRSSNQSTWNWNGHMEISLFELHGRQPSCQVIHPPTRHLGILIRRSAGRSGRSNKRIFWSLLTRQGAAASFEWPRLPSLHLVRLHGEKMADVRWIAARTTTLVTMQYRHQDAPTRCCGIVVRQISLHGGTMADAKWIAARTATLSTMHRHQDAPTRCCGILVSQRRARSGKSSKRIFSSSLTRRGAAVSFEWLQRPNHVRRHRPLLIVDTILIAASMPTWNTIQPRCPHPDTLTRRRGVLTSRRRDGSGRIRRSTKRNFWGFLKMQGEAASFECHHPLRVHGVESCRNAEYPFTNSSVAYHKSPASLACVYLDCFKILKYRHCKFQDRITYQGPPGFIFGQY